MAESGFNFQKLMDDSKSVLTNPKGYFSSMAKEGGFVEPIIKALVYGVVAGVISLIWSLLHFSAASSMMGGIFGVGPVAIIIGSIIGAVIGLFIGGIIILIVSAICGGTTNFEANVRVAAALMVLSPVNALLSVFSGVHLYLGLFISLVVALYGLYLFYNALVSALGAKEGTAKVVSIILAVIPVLMLISTLVCASAVSKYGDKMMKEIPAADSKEMKELQNKLKELQDMQKK